MDDYENPMKLKDFKQYHFGIVHMSPQFRPAPAAHAQLLPITECKSPLDARKLSTSPAVDVGGAHPHSHDGLSVES